MDNGNKNGNIKRVPANFFLLTGSRVVDAVAVPVSSIIIARYLGAAGFGEFSFVTAYVVSLVTLAYFGLDNITTRELAKRGEDSAPRYFGAIILSRWILLAVVLGLLASSFPFFVERRLYAVLAAITISEFAGAVASTFISVFRAFERVEYEMAATIIWRLSYLLLIASAAYLDLGIEGISIVIFLSSAIRLGTSVFIVRKKFIRPDLSADFRMIRSILAEAAVIGAAVLLGNWFHRSSQIALKFLTGSESVGIFQAAQSIVFQTGMLATSFSISLLPLLSRLANADVTGEGVRKIYMRASKFLLWASVPVCVLIIAFSKEVVNILFGAEFAGTIPVLRFAAVSIVPLFLASLNFFIFVVHKRNAMAVASWIAALGIIILLHLALVPAYGAVGAAWSYAFSGAALVFIHFILFRAAGLSKVGLPAATYVVCLAVCAASALFISHETWFPARVAAAGAISAAAIVMAKRNLKGLMSARVGVRPSEP